MKKFVDEITVSDEGLMLDIVHHLENCPISGREYEVEMCDRGGGDDPMSRRTGRFALRIFVKECV